MTAQFNVWCYVNRSFVMKLTHFFSHFSDAFMPRTWQSVSFPFPLGSAVLEAAPSVLNAV